MILGVDTSTYIEELEHGAKFYFEGKEIDPLDRFVKNGVSYMRIRLWHNPYTLDGKPYLAGNCDLKNFIELSKLAMKKGFKILLDIHYSDFWVDPAKQTLPKAWANHTYEELQNDVYNYTKEVLVKAKEEGEVVSEVDNNNGTVTVTYTFTGNLIDATEYGGRTFESASCNLTLAQGGNQNNAPKYYDNGNALRVYFKNTLTLQAASGCEIVSATVSIGSVNKITVNDLSANAGSVSLSGSNAPAVATISGVNASSLTITVAPEGTKGNLGITSVSVVIASVR